MFQCNPLFLKSYLWNQFCAHIFNLFTLKTWCCMPTPWISQMLLLFPIATAERRLYQFLLNKICKIYYRLYKFYKSNLLMSSLEREEKGMFNTHIWNDSYGRSVSFLIHTFKVWKYIFSCTHSCKYYIANSLKIPSNLKNC